MSEAIVLVGAPDSEGKRMFIHGLCYAIIGHGIYLVTGKLHDLSMAPEGGAGRTLLNALYLRESSERVSLI